LLAHGFVYAAGCTADAPACAATLTPLPSACRRFSRRRLSLPPCLFRLPPRRRMLLRLRYFCAAEPFSLPHFLIDAQLYSPTPAAFA